MSEINSTLNERGERYGNYSDVAGTTQQLMFIVESGANYKHLNAEQKTSLFMICNKIARAVNGDPDYEDNWHDIAGYATLAEKACEKAEDQISNGARLTKHKVDFTKHKIDLRGASD